MTKIEQLESKHEAAWMEYKVADESIKPIRDKWLAIAKELEREKVREEIRQEAETK